MVKIVVSCLPQEDEKAYKSLFTYLVQAVSAVRPLGLRSEEDMLILFPPDHMKYGLGTEIHVDISCLWDLPARTTPMRALLAHNVGSCIDSFYEIRIPRPAISVCIEPPMSRADHSFWNSGKGWSNNCYWKGWRIDDYFSVERLQLFNVSSQGATRIRSALLKRYGDDEVMGEMLVHYQEDKTKMSNFSRVCAQAVSGMLRHDNLLP